MIHETTTNQPPPWMLANLLSSTNNSNCGSSGDDDSPSQETSTSTSSLLQQILPGPFTVLQGSPGDGMSNTLDSMPMLPLDSMTKNNDEEAESNYNSSSQSQHRRCSSMSLHPLEEVADEEEGNDGNGGTAINESAANTRPHTPLDKNDDGEGNNNNSIIGRERSDSLTGGGLHYPLGEKSPIMQRRVCRPSLTSNFMQQQTSSFSSPSITSSSAQTTTETTADGSNKVPLMPFGDEGSNNGNISNYDTPTTLQRRQQQVSSIISSSSSISHENQPQQPSPSPFTPTEITSISKWANEVTQQTKMHLDERNQNVKLLLDRRKRSSLQLQQQRQRQREVELQHHADEIATATSASDSTVDDDESGRIISRSPSPMLLSTPPSSSSPTSSPPHELEQQLQSSITIEDEHINSFELEISHRSWYQKDGRLIVFKSLPCIDLQSGKVVTDPIVIDGQHRGDAAEGMNVVTIAPGSTVMAEEAITLDSRSLKIIHSTANRSASSTDDDKRRSHGSSSNGATLCFLSITSPYAGYILSHVHNYPYLAPGSPTTYTNSTWLWRVTCHPDGAFIRSGLDLVTDHIGTLPYGSFCSVEKKVVNYMGLNRLQIAFVNNDSGGDKQLSGYISEFLNPLSGQRGNIVEQVSFPVPALYKVKHCDGAIIRSGVELSTGQIGFAPKGSVLSIIGRSYSSNPSNNCIERLRLAGGGGWISANLNREGNEEIVEMLGADESFDPEDPARFHFVQQKKVMAELKADNSKSASGSNQSGGTNNYLPRRRSTANLSEIGEDDQISIPDSEGNSAGIIATNDMARASILSSSPSRQSSASAVPTLFQRSGVVGGMMGGLAAMDAVRESSSDRHIHQNDNANRCLICLSE